MSDSLLIEAGAVGDLPPADALATMADYFAAHGSTERPGSARPFLLAGDAVWLVAEGYVDVFAVLLAADGTAIGRRAHLVRIPAGRPLLADATPAGAAGGHGLLAVAAAGTRLERLGQPEVRALAATVDGAAPVAALVEAWVEALYAAMCDALPRGTVPAHCAELVGGSDAVRLTPGTSARPRAGVAWVRHVHGHSHLLGHDDLLVNGAGLTPVSRRAWLEVREPGALALADLAAADPAAVWDGLARLHGLVRAYAATLDRQSADVSRERLRRRVAADRDVLRGACACLASTLDVTGGVGYIATDAAEPRPAGWEDALLAAARRVGEAAGTPIRSYARGEGITAPRDPLAALARASRLRVRQVALRDGWWRQDAGPLLATLMAPDASPAAPGDAVLRALALLGRGPLPRPVALVPARRGGYQLHDPTTGRATRVCETVAAALQPFAHAFYRPFPARALGVLDIARFGLRGCGRDLAVVAAMGLAGALLGMLPSYATGVLFNSVIPGAQRPQLLQLTLVLVVCALAAALFNITRAVALLRVEGRMSGAVQAAVWDRLLSLPMPFFRPYTAGNLAVRAMGIDAIRQVVSGATVSAVLGGVFSLVNFALMFSYSPAMAWRASLLILVAVAITAVGSWLQLRHQRGVSAIQARVSGVVLQLLMAVAKLRVAGAEPRAFAQWASRFSEQRRLQFRAERVGNVVAAVQAAFPTIASVVLFATALPLLQGGAGEEPLRTGDFLAFLAAYGSCQGALLAACGALLSTLSTVPLYEQARPILASTPEVDEAKTDPGALTGDIAIQRAHFRYTPEGPLVLRDVNLQVRPGEFVAFVGPSGSGKSTILRLLLAFERLESGAIYYDGQDLAGLDAQAVRRQLGVVLQNGQLMSGDIFTNICGSAQMSLDEAWEAARLAGFEDDVRAMPMGMHTVISEGAGTLSGGQRQRLMIARAIVQRPRLLFFDEATSALDNRTQAIVSASLDQLQATRIVVAHRLSTIVHADRIVVIQRGQVVQEGCYEDLMARPGLFAELARRQIA